MQLQSNTKEKIQLFVKDLNGRFRHHISDELMVIYLCDQFSKEKFESGENALERNIAYRSCVYLFETLLEHGCNEPMNGHHVAQKFCEYFI